MVTNQQQQLRSIPRRHRAAVWLAENFPGRALRLLLCAAFLYGAAARSLGQDVSASSSPAADPSLPKQGADMIVLPPSVPDPAEHINRVFWSVNEGLMAGVVSPSGKVYRRVVIRPFRRGIRNFGRNLLYPPRLLDNLLQGKWAGAGNETSCFLCNTLFGAGGLFDVAAEWKIPKSDADAGQTLGSWGWTPDFYLMLPLLGPSNDRDAVGLLADAAADPLTYFTPYAYIPMGVTYNNLTDQVDGYIRFVRSEMDAYSLVQYAWTFARKNQVLNFQVTGKQDLPSLETLQSVFFTFENPEFPDRGKTRSAVIPGTGKKLVFTYWLQKEPAPVVYIVPGLGSHRLAETSLALAELMYKNGFSAVCVSSPFNFEFMERASTVALPAYPPTDAHDLHVALTEIDRRLEGLYPNRMTHKALLGYSLGAFQALLIASDQAAKPSSLLGNSGRGVPPLLQPSGQPAHPSSLIEFDRVVAINTPVRLTYGMAKLDEFYQAPLAWPAAQRIEKIQNTFLKVAALSRTSLRPQMSLPFDGVESKFLVGLAFRFLLRDIIYASQRRHNQGVLRQPLKSMRRQPAYREIMQFSYEDYFSQFAIPYYQTQGINLAASGELEKAGDLRSRAAGLRANPRLRLIANEDDFLMAEPDLAWLRETFSTNQLTVFARGGHLGNLSHPAVQRAIVAGLEDLKPHPAPPRELVPPKPKDRAPTPALPVIP